jgi:hypothetical protein
MDNVHQPSHLGTKGADDRIHVEPLFPLRNADQIKESEPIFQNRIHRTPEKKDGPSHLEIGLQLLALVPCGDGHDVLHPHRLDPCTARRETHRHQMDRQRPMPPDNTRSEEERGDTAHLRGAGWCGGRPPRPRRAARRGQQRRRRALRRSPWPRPGAAQGQGCGGGATWRLGVGVRALSSSAAAEMETGSIRFGTGREILGKGSGLFGLPRPGEGGDCIKIRANGDRRTRSSLCLRGWISILGSTCKRETFTRFFRTPGHHSPARNTRSGSQNFGAVELRPVYFWFFVNFLLVFKESKKLLIFLGYLAFKSFKS